VSAEPKSGQIAPRVGRRSADWSAFLSSGSFWKVLLACWGCLHLAMAVGTTVYAASWPLNGYWGDQSGGSQLNFALYIARGANYFTRGPDYPMLMPQTPGLFPLLIAPFAKLWGPSLYYGTVLGLLNFVVTMACTFILARRMTGSGALGLAALGFLLSFPRMATQFPDNRPESLAYALGIAAVLTAVNASQSREGSHGRWTLSALLAVAACYAKQHSVIAGVSVSAFLLYQKRIRTLAWYLFCALLFGLLPLIVLQRWTEGGFLFHIVVGARAMTRFGWEHWRNHVILATIGLAPLLFFVRVEMLVKVRKRSLSPLHFYASLSFAFAVATIWHIGGSFGYFGWALTGLAPLGACGLQTVLSSASQLSAAPRRRVQSVAAVSWPILWALLLALCSPWVTLRQTWWQAIESTDPTYRAQVEAVYEALADLPGDILTERLTGLEVLQGRKVEVETHTLPLLAERGLWDPTTLASDLARGRWPYIAAMDRGDGLFAGMQTIDAAFRQGYQRLDDAAYPIGGREITLWQSRFLGQ
jgi:hypothetical protein